MKTLLFCVCFVGMTVTYASDEYDVLEEKIGLQLKKEVKFTLIDDEVNPHNDRNLKQNFETLPKNGIKNKNSEVESDNLITENDKNSSDGILKNYFRYLLSTFFN